jgi:hypothetical protein
MTAAALAFCAASLTWVAWVLLNIAAAALGRCDATYLDETTETDQ